MSLTRWAQRKSRGELILDLVLFLVVAGFALLLLVPPKGQSSTGQTEAQPQNGTTPQNNAQIIALRRAILGQESGGKFDAVNPHSGALGYAQLMPANVKAWGREAIGREPSKQEFLSKPELQLQIIDHKLQLYWQEELKAAAGDEQTAVMRVASRWYSGNANLYTSTRTQYYKTKDGKQHRYPSISAYSWAVWRKYRGAKTAERRSNLDSLNN